MKTRASFSFYTIEIQRLLFILFGFGREVIMTQTAQEVSFQSGNRQLEGYLARPEGDGPFPGIVVIHEAYGLNENMKDIARRFADQGYVALAVDLFAGRNRAICMFQLIGGLLLRSLNNRGVHDLKAALTFLSAQPEVDDARLGAVGYCMGGSYAIAWACTDNRLKAIAPYYAGNPRPLEAVARLCPVVGHTQTRTSRPNRVRSWMWSWNAMMCRTTLRYILVQSIRSSTIPVKRVIMRRRHRIRGGGCWLFLGSISA